MSSTSEVDDDTHQPRNGAKKRKTSQSPVSTGLACAPFHVAIVGGGIGGLGLALALQQHGISCTVFERDARLEDRRQGYGLTLTNNSKGPLAKLGLLKACVEADCPSNSHWIFAGDGSVLGYYGRAFKPAASNNSAGRGNLRVPRQDLRRMLLDKLHPDTVQWGHRIASCSSTPSHVSLTFVNGATAKADLLVGADGLRSEVRAHRDLSISTPKKPVVSELRYLGISVIIGLSTLTHPLLDQRGYYALDGRARLFTMPYLLPSEDSSSPPLTMWQLSFSGLTEEEGMKLRQSSSKQQLDKALEITSAWFPAVHDMMRSTAEEDIWATPLYDRDPMSLRPKQSPDSDHGRITVIGDACHPMSMFKGQGANQALEDGPLLASWLAKPGLNESNLLTRVKCFEREMIARTTSKVLASRQAALTYHSPEVLNEVYSVDGIDDEKWKEIVSVLQSKGIGATCPTLEDEILQLIDIDMSTSVG